ncbi:MAG: BatD family protein [Lysobacter sp.]
MINSTARILLHVCAYLLLLTSLSATAKTRAWLDRDHIALGETATLNIETDTGTAPDYAPLARDFQLSGRTSRRQVELAGGKITSRTLYAVALRARRDGVLTIPGLQVGGEKTSPLPLVVGAASAAAPVQAQSDVFVESEPDDGSPYVQQAVGWTVRLYSAVPLVSGQLDQPTPDGASLNQVGEDLQFSRQIGGREYSVVERHYLLIPDRSGELVIPGAVFRGRGVNGFFGDLMGRGDGLQATAPSRRISVQPLPSQVSQGWLPLHGLQLRYLATPQSAKAGTAAILSVEAVVDGASAAQLPELTLPEIPGAQVFPDPVQAEERWVDGRPQVTLRRQFSLVPSQSGALTIPGARLQWWDVSADRMRTATLPTLQLDVAAGAVGAPGITGPAGLTDAPVGGPAPGSALPRSGEMDQRPWVLATVFFGVAWLLTLLWGLQRAAGAGTSRTVPDAAVRPASKAPVLDRAELAKALDHGDFDQIATLLCGLAWPAAVDLDEVATRLADPAQRDALAAMRRARWGGGDGVAARETLRAAFAGGPVWRDAVEGEPASALLPPLYPPHGK